MIRTVRNLIIVVLLASFFCPLANAQKKYDEIYASLPTLSPGQQYSELIGFQRLMPTFANVYAQLGMVSEKRLFSIDPLRKSEQSQFWAYNAGLFYGNFSGYYKDGDARSNSEFYVNLQIPHEGKRPSDAETRAFFAAHRVACKNFGDSTLMVYNALFKSKRFYNRCISDFMTLSQSYVNRNAVLLAYDDKMERFLQNLGNEMDSCLFYFAEYKRLLHVHPILNYDQEYSLRPVETFRLDGLTNSDFYQPKFTLWDFAKWVAEYRAECQSAIFPLRQAIEEINTRYVAGVVSYRKEVLSDALLTRPYDDKFIFMLGKYDNSSLVRELFSYLEVRRNMMVLSRDSIALASAGSPSIYTRKMRQAVRVSTAALSARDALSNFESQISEERVARFRSFFEKNYLGMTGLRTVSHKETSFINEVLSDVLNRLSAYWADVARQRSAVSYSTKNKQIPAIPTWIVDESELSSLNGNYVTTHATYDTYGRVAYVAGRKKNGAQTPFVSHIDGDNITDWVVDVKNAGEVLRLYGASDACAVVVRTDAAQSCALFNENGKEIMRFGMPEGNVNVVDYNGLSKLAHSVVGSPNGVAYCVNDSTGARTLNVTLPNWTSATSVYDVADGVLVFGFSADGLSVQRVSDKGELGKMSVVKDAVRINDVFRASAQEFYVFFSDTKLKPRLAIVDENCSMKIVL